MTSRGPGATSVMSPAVGVLVGRKPSRAQAWANQRASRTAQPRGSLLKNAKTSALGP